MLAADGAGKRRAHMTEQSGRGTQCWRRLSSRKELMMAGSPKSDRSKHSAAPSGVSKELM